MKIKLTDHKQFHQENFSFGLSQQRILENPTCLQPEIKSEH